MSSDEEHLRLADTTNDNKLEWTEPELCFIVQELMRVIWQ